MVAAGIRPATGPQTPQMQFSQHEILTCRRSSLPTLDGLLFSLCFRVSGLVLGEVDCVPTLLAAHSSSDVRYCHRHHHHHHFCDIDSIQVFSLRRCRTRHKPGLRSLIFETLVLTARPTLDLQSLLPQFRPSYTQPQQPKVLKLRLCSLRIERHLAAVAERRYETVISRLERLV